MTSDSFRCVFYGFMPNTLAQPLVVALAVTALRSGHADSKKFSVKNLSGEYQVISLFIFR